MWTWSQPGGLEATQCHPVPSARKKCCQPFQFERDEVISHCSCPPTACPEGDSGWRKTGTFPTSVTLTPRQLSCVPTCSVAQSCPALRPQGLQPAGLLCPVRGSHPRLLRFLLWQADSLPLSHFLCMGSPFHRKKRAKIITLRCLFLVISSNLLLTTCLPSRKSSSISWLLPCLLGAGPQRC